MTMSENVCVERLTKFFPERFFALSGKKRPVEGFIIVGQLSRSTTDYLFPLCNCALPFYSYGVTTITVG